MPGGPKISKSAALDTPLRGIPQPPAHLSPDAKRHWRDVCTRMEQAGFLSLLDKEAIGLYVSLWCRWREAQSKIADEGVVIPTGRGGSQENPWYKIEFKTLQEMSKILESFGMTPRSRTKMKVIEPEQIDTKWLEPGDE